VKYTPQGTAVAKFSLATNERFKDKQGNGRTYRVAQHYLLGSAGGDRRRVLKKGRTVYIEGRLQTDSWMTSRPARKYMTNIVANDLVLLGGKGGEGSGGGGGEEAATQADALAAARPATTSIRAPTNPLALEVPRRAPRSPTTIFRSNNVVPICFCCRCG